MIFNRQAGLFGATHKVQSPRTDASHRWFAISNILASNGVKDVVKEMREHRSFFGDTTRSLQMISVVIDKMVEAAHKMGAPICVPELLPEGAHVISFDSLYPVHLYGQAGVKKVIPINSLPDLGANLIGLTGHHGGGKTATEEGLLDALWYAHSGLPVLAESFRFNMKRALGAVFIERGDGSTVSMMLDKMVEVLKRCKRLNGSEVVLILDELGSATQEGDGTELGCDYLTKLMAMGISVVFSCQIRQLAEYAQNQLGAKCFQFNRKHELRPGIGDGGMKELRRDKGLDALLR